MKPPALEENIQYLQGNPQENQQSINVDVTTSKSATLKNNNSNNDNDPHAALTKCLFSQYGFTFASISISTAYSLYKRPKNGMSIMLMAGGTGTVVDFFYGYFVNCSKEVQASQQYYYQQQNEKLNNNTDTEGK